MDGMERIQEWGDSARRSRILRGWGVKGVRAAGVGEEPESCLCRARVAEEAGERGPLVPEGREKGGTLGGVERAVKEEVFASLRFAAARAEKSFRFEVRLVGAEIAGASA